MEMFSNERDKGHLEFIGKYPGKYTFSSRKIGNLFHRAILDIVRVFYFYIKQTVSSIWNFPRIIRSDFVIIFFTIVKINFFFASKVHFILMQTAPSRRMSYFVKYELEIKNGSMFNVKKISAFAGNFARNVHLFSNFGQFINLST